MVLSWQLMMLDEKGKIQSHIQNIFTVALDRYGQNYVTAIVLVELFGPVIPETWHTALFSRYCTNIM